MDSESDAWMDSAVFTKPGIKERLTKLSASLLLFCPGF